MSDQILYTTLNTILRGACAKRTAETLVALIGLIGLQVLALEVSR